MGHPNATLTLTLTLTKTYLPTYLCPVIFPWRRKKNKMSEKLFQTDPASKFHGKSKDVCPNGADARTLHAHGGVLN